MSDQRSYAGRVLASSACGAPLLIMIQLSVKMFTFAGNQLVLRSVSPAILGIASQLDLCSVSILYFSREAVRNAIQRQPLIFVSEPNIAKGDAPNGHNRQQSRDTLSRASQSVVNAAYLSLAAGIPLAVAVTMFYMYFAPDKAVGERFFHSSVTMTVFASLLELGTEPFFVIVQQHMFYKTRAVVEMSAAFIKCVTVCSACTWASWTGNDVGVLPFALGYMSYAVALFCGYCITVLKTANENQFSFFLTRLYSSDTSGYIADRFSRPLVSFSASVFFQSAVKHLLSQGDSMILATMATLEDQGIYSLASNYGSLIARIVFQPIEESSRNLFSLLLSPNESGMRDMHTVGAAKSHLIDILRGYGVLSALILPLGPHLAPRMIHLLGGRRWASPEVNRLLSLYCYYIPLLAFNGITEALVSSAASPADLRKHAVWMGFFSACFTAAAFAFLKIGGLGAPGLVWASIVTMTVRLLWSYRFIGAYFRKNGNELAISSTVVRLITVVVAVMFASIMSSAQKHPVSDVKSTAILLGLGAAYTLLILYLERSYVVKQYRKVSSILKSRAGKQKAG